jgi:hypothetical protein
MHPHGHGVRATSPCDTGRHPLSERLGCGLGTRIASQRRLVVIFYLWGLVWQPALGSFLWEGQSRNFCFHGILRSHLHTQGGGLFSVSRGEAGVLSFAVH